MTTVEKMRYRIGIYRKTETVDRDIKYMAVRENEKEVKFWDIICLILFNIDPIILKTGLFDDL